MRCVAVPRVESMEPMEEVPLIQLGKAELERLVRILLTYAI